MKKLLYSAAIFGMMTAVFASCDKNKNKNKGGNGDEGFDGRVTATIESGTYFNAVKENITHVRSAFYGYTGWQTNAYTTFTGNGFSLLLDSIESTNLFSVEGQFYEDFLNISDKTANINYVDFEAHAGGNFNNWIGNFYHGKYSETMTSTRYAMTATDAMYFYADKEVTITGTDQGSETEEGITFNWQETVNLHFKQGWNIMYYTEDVSLDVPTMQVTVKITQSTNPVAGLKWYYDEDWYALFPELELSSPVKKAVQKFQKNKRTNLVAKK
jgi:hypothetical protein